MKNHRLQYPSVCETLLLLFIVALGFIGLSLGGCSAAPVTDAQRAVQAANIAQTFQASAVEFEQLEAGVVAYRSAFTDREWELIQTTIADLEQAHALAAQAAANPAGVAESLPSLVFHVQRFAETYEQAAQLIRERKHEFDPGLYERVKALDTQYRAHFVYFMTLQASTGNPEAQEIIRTVGNIAITGLKIYAAASGVPPV